MFRAKTETTCKSTLHDDNLTKEVTVTKKVSALYLKLPVTLESSANSEQ